jgi:hypothetical protein
MATSKTSPLTAAAPAAPEPLPQAGGSYLRQPDGSLVLQKPKVELADLVAAKAAPSAQPTEPPKE